MAAFYADRACSLRSEATRKSWGYTYRWLQRLLPDKPVGGFSTDDLVAFVTQRGWDSPQWAPSTARNYRSAFQSLFGWAHAAGRIPVDPAWRLGQRVRIRRVRVWQPHWLTEPQIAALLALTPGDDDVSQRDRTLLMLGLFAGLRTGEMSGLTWRRTHLEHGLIEVAGKAAKLATACRPPQLRDQLRAGSDQLGHHIGLDTPLGDVPVLPIFVCPGGSNVFAPRRPFSPLTREGIRRVVHGYGDRLGVDYLRPHDLRRSLAGTLDASDTPIKDIRDLLRHDTIAATEIYLAHHPLRVHKRIAAFTIELGQTLKSRRELPEPVSAKNMSEACSYGRVAGAASRAGHLEPTFGD